MKALVAYFSAQGTTAALAKTLAEKTGADLFEIRPVTPYTAADIQWTSSDSDVASVSANGVVTGKGLGVATITATSADGRATASCLVTVTYTPWQWVKHYVLFGWAWE